MTTITEMKKRLQGLSILDVAQQAIKQTSEILLDFNREQLLEGKRRDGADISPSYFEDPYFKSPESAIRYSKWKDKITPNPKRKKGVPNLYINGFFHNSIIVDVSGEEIKFASPYSGEPSIVAKFTDKIYGLNSEKRTDYIRLSLGKVFITIVKENLLL